METNFFNLVESRPIIDISYFIPPPEDNGGGSSNRIFKTGDSEFTEEELEGFISNILDFTKNNFSPESGEEEESQFFDTLEEYLSNMGKLKKGEEFGPKKGFKRDFGEETEDTERGPGERRGESVEAVSNTEEIDFSDTASTDEPVSGVGYISPNIYQNTNITEQGDDNGRFFTNKPRRMW